MADNLDIEILLDIDIDKLLENVRLIGDNSLKLDDLSQKLLD